jgi:hypothetical protein
MTVAQIQPQRADAKNRAAPEKTIFDAVSPALRFKTSNSLQDRSRHSLCLALHRCSEIAFSRSFVMRRKTVSQFFILSLLAAPILAQTVATPRTEYDRTTESAIAGTVVGVDVYRVDSAVGVHLIVNTGQALVNVVAGPATYLGQNNFSFLLDDRIVVIGPRVSRAGYASVWARTIAKGSTMLVMRNEDGTPKWTPATDGADGCGVNHAPFVRTTEK